jgi:serine/threonine protein kinase
MSEPSPSRRSDPPPAGRTPTRADGPRLTADVSPGELAAVLRAEQQARWQAGERVPAEAYVQRLPGDPPDPEAAAGFVLQECLLRARLGERPDAGEFLARFPQYAAVLRDRIDLRRALTASTADGTRDGGAAGMASERPEPTIEAPAGAAGTAPPAGAPPGYELLGELGRGGMGVVYRARPARLNRLVALKVILTGGHAAAADRVRFLAEAEAVAALAHPNVVQVFECGMHDGQPYLALEYCPGGSLADKLRGTPLPPRAAAALVEPLARAVQAAHGRGIVHRDLKPANVLLADDGTPKVTDFGLAKRVEGGAGLTQTGAILGTPSYMAPEQAAGSKAVGPAADVYALGAVLYECLTGRPPFRAETALDTLQQVLTDDPVPVGRLQPRTPCDLETICLKCLRKEPDKRFPAAGALADDLRRFLDHRPIQARPVSRLERAWKWAKRNPELAKLYGNLLAFSVFLVGAVYLASWSYTRTLARAANAAEERVRRILDALELVESDRATAHAAMLNLTSGLAKSFRDRGMLAEAEALLRERLAYLQRLRRSDHPLFKGDIAYSLDLLGECLVEMGKAVEAETLLRESLALRTSGHIAVLGPWASLYVANTESLLGSSLVPQGRYAEAEPLLLKSYGTLKGFDKSVVPDPALKAAAMRVVKLFEAWGKADELARWRAEVSSLEEKPPAPAGPAPVPS